MAIKDKFDLTVEEFRRRWKKEPKRSPPSQPRNMNEVKHEKEAKAAEESRTAEEARAADAVVQKELEEKAERDAREKAERDAKEKAERDAKEKAERDAREKAERDAKEKAERDAREKAEAERARRSSLSLLERQLEDEAKEKERGADVPPREVERPKFDKVLVARGSEIIRSGKTITKKTGNQVMSAGSFSDSAISEGVSKVYKQQDDSNQDVIVMKRDSETAINGLYLVFDGVSRSTLPRQWAEILAKKIIKRGLNSLLDETKLGEIWRDSVGEFEKYMRDNRPKITDGMMEWMKKSVPDFAATTLVALEIKDDRASLVCHGDSCAFVIGRDNVRHFLPKEIGGYVSSIRSDLEPSIHDFETAKFEFTSGVDIILLTDGYSDPIHKLEPVAQRKRLSELIEALEDADSESAMQYTKRMISEGDKGFRFEHDDMSYLIVRKLGG